MEVFIMRVIEYTITTEYNDRPLLHFLKGYVKLSTHIVQSLRHTHGAVIVNSKPSPKPRARFVPISSRKTREGELIPKTDLRA